VKAARQRQISKIYFIQTQGDFLIDAMDKDFLIPFTYSFGAIIDILSQFKPIEKVKA
jgi:hypothetical protein